MAQLPSSGPQRATLVDVAAAAQVSRQTVSNALNHPHRLTPQTLQRVQAHIKALGFQPNRAARSLRRQRANAVGFQIAGPTWRGFRNVLDPFLATLTASVQEADAHLVTFVCDEADTLTMYEKLLSTQVVDGFVLSQTAHDDPRAAWLRERNVPFVSFGRIWDDPSVTAWVDVDGQAGTAAAVTHLRAEGYRRIGWVGWPEGSPVGDDRRTGWLRSCSDLNQDCAALAVESVHDPLATAQAVGPLIDRLEPGDAVVCVSDVVAVGVTMALGERGLRPGVDIGVVGFDDSDLALTFRLSSVRQPLATIAGLLTRMLETPETPRQGVVVQPVLVARDSSSRAPDGPVISSSPGRSSATTVRPRR